MEILAAYDLTGSLRDAAELAGCSHHTVARYVGAREAGRVPGGPPGGLPAGMMIVGRHFADDMCLRIARGYEAAVGGFPAPPGY